MANKIKKEITNMTDEQKILFRSLQIALDYFFGKYNFSEDDKKNLLINSRIKAINEFDEVQ